MSSHLSDRNSDPLSELLREREGFPEAEDQLRLLLDQRAAEVKSAADGYGDVYRGQRAAMVFDVVASRQRRYETRVQAMVAAFSRLPASKSLANLASAPDLGGGLRTGEADTIVGVAQALCRFGTDREISDDDEICRAWAEATAPLVLSHRLDPYVGTVKGIGPALFCYLRMRCGADGLKPDLRVRNAFKTLGLRPPRGEAALLVLGQVLAQGLGIREVELDQLLWWPSDSTVNHAGG